MSKYRDTDEVLEQIRKKLGIKSLDYLLEAERQIVDAIQSAPSIDIEPKRGEWINKIVDDVKITVCSNCNKEPTFTHYYGSCGNYSLSDFCPNCGARMKGADDETSD